MLVEGTETPDLSERPRGALASTRPPPVTGQRDFDKQLKVLLSVLTVLSTASLCTSLPFLGASSLFQTPFLAVSTITFSIATWRKHQVPLDRRIPSNDVEASEETGLLSPQSRSPVRWSVDYNEMSKVQNLAVHWLFVSVLVMAISGVLTYASAISNLDSVGSEAQ